MGGYALRRTVLVVPVVWGAITLLFLAFFVLPGDPVEVIGGAGSGRSVSPAVRTAIEEKYGLDKPWYEQYGHFWNRLAHGDLGDSFKQSRSVNEVLGATAPASIRLAIWAVIVEVLIGVTAGVISAVRRYSFLDSLTTVSTTMVVAVPVFVLGYVFQYMLGVYTFQHGFPTWARMPVQGIGPDSWALFFVPTGGQWRYLVLPAVTLASVSTALVARMTRTAMLEVLRADYMRTARAKGLGEQRVIVKHGLRNALIPVITLIGIDFGTVIGAAVLTEFTFSWPGLGSEIVTSVQQRDLPVILGLTLAVVLAYALVNVVVDVSYAWFDPRIRLGKGEHA